MGADHKTVMIDLLLAGRRLVTVKAIDALLRVCGYLVFVNYRVLKACVTFGAFSRRPHEVGGRLSRFDTGSRAVHKKSGQNERKCDDDSQEHGTKRHAVNPSGIYFLPGSIPFTRKQNTENVTGSPTDPH
jgi:hypothetical protein